MSSEFLRPLLIALLSIAFLSQTNFAEEPTISRIGFGSCARQSKPQPIWDSVVDTRPDLFLMLGDNIYGDTRDMEVLKKKYGQLGAQPGFQKLRATTPVLATWDDHDYGVNDGGAEYPMKRQSQQVFLDFFRAPQDDPRRSREGVYSENMFGPKGKRVQIILLDTRYFRSPLVYSKRKAEPGEGYRGLYGADRNPSSTILGAAQWKWLEQQLRKPAELRIIGSSVQVVSDEHGWEMWGNFPLERQRLFRLLRSTKANGVVFLSGDRHTAEISEMPANEEGGVGYPIIDVTSSSLNVPSGNMTAAGIRFSNELNRYRQGLTYFDVNYGMVLIDWAQSDPEVRLQVRGEKGGVMMQRRLRLSDLNW